jgi:hypothetical protein
MAYRRQHYVPQAYLKNWETQVTSKREPNKKFDGVYYYEKRNLLTGDGRNKDTILWLPRLYTVDYNLSFIYTKCPKIANDFFDQIITLLDKRSVNAYKNDNQLKTIADLYENFLDLDNWEFRYKQYPYNIAKKTAILNEIKQMNSNVIENALDQVLENKWQKSLDDFLDQMENTIPLNGIDEIRQIEEETVIEIVKMVIFMICRNPDFNCINIFTDIERILLSVFGKDYTKEQMDAAWLFEIYKALFSIAGGYYDSYFKNIKSSFQIMLFKCWEDQGTFITSDMPAFEHICLIEKDNLNSIIFPLTPKYLIMLMRGESNSLRNVNFRMADNLLIKKFNRIIFNHSRNAIVSNYKHLGYIL